MKQTTRTHILNAALKLAVKKGYKHVLREEIAAEADVTPSLVSYHFGTMIEFRRAIMREAVRVECLPIIAQGLAAGDKHARKCTPEVQQAALATLAVAG